jgi:tyrosine-specific transport protein
VIVGVMALILMGNLRWVDHHNRLLFLGMLAAMMALIIGLGSYLMPKDIIVIEAGEVGFSAWQIAIPVIFTSFGYHIIQNTMVIYCDYNPVALKKAFFWGSLIPLVVYVVWVVVTLLILYLRAPEFYHTLLTQKAELGQLIEALSHAVGCSWLQPVSWVVALLAILTSAIGVGLAVVSFWEQHLPAKIAGRPLVLVLVLLPPLLVGIWTPSVFIRALSFAGLILTIIAIFLPLYLLRMSDKVLLGKVFYPLTSYKSLRIAVFLMGVLVVVCEVTNLIK